jgi:hypothetical protein
MTKPTNAADVLQQAADTYRARNKVYGDNYRMVGPIMQTMFPQGAPAELLGSDQFHLFELIIVKLTRFAISNLTHQDSIHDAAVYAAMIEGIVNECDPSNRRNERPRQGFIGEP